MLQPRLIAFITLFACLAWGLLSTAATAAIEIAADETIDYSAYVTFTVEVGTPSSRERAQLEITAEVTAAVINRGLRPVDLDPDLIVRTHVLVDTHTLEELADEGRWEFLTGVRSITAYDLGEGTLVIDFIDATTNETVWRGLTTERLGSAMESNYNRLPKIVRRVINKYPKR